MKYVFGQGAVCRRSGSREHELRISLFSFPDFGKEGEGRKAILCRGGEKGACATNRRDARPEKKS